MLFENKSIFLKVLQFGDTSLLKIRGWDIYIYIQILGQGVNWLDFPWFLLSLYILWATVLMNVYIIQEPESSKKKHGDIFQVIYQENGLT